MTSKLNIKAEDRKVTGRKVKKLRESGIMPANLFGKKLKSKSIQVAYGDFIKVFSVAKETGLIDLEVGKDKYSVLIHDTQLNPLSGDFIHADFIVVDLKEKINAKVPVVLMGESPAEKQGLGTVVLQIDEIEVEALPTDLPEKFEVNVGDLNEVDQTVLIKDLIYDRKKVKVMNNDDDIVVKIEPLMKEEEVQPPAEIEEEGVSKEEIKEEGASEEESKIEEGQDLPEK